MSTIIHSYASGGVTYNTVRTPDGEIKRNGSCVKENRNGRKYLTTKRHRKRFLCIEEGCYKNTKFGALCRDHAPEEETRKPVKKLTEDELLWRDFNNAEEELEDEW